METKVYIKSVNGNHGLYGPKPDGNIHTMPVDGRPHIESSDCWCGPDLIEDYSDSGGFKLYLHKEFQ